MLAIVLAVSQLGLRCFSRCRFRGRAYLEKELFNMYVTCVHTRKNSEGELKKGTSKDSHLIMFMIYFSHRIITSAFAKTKDHLYELLCWLLCTCEEKVNNCVNGIQ